MSKKAINSSPEEPRSRMVYPLTTEEQQQAISEGWDVFLFESESGEVIHRLEKHDEAGVLKNDMEAWSIVYSGHRKAESIHKKVWEFLKAHSPSEYEEINKSMLIHRIQLH
ncbi:hypothetical protein LMH73_008740 [Vibrio splendidus]|nr:hypothetical protein [Vibrio splendidus]MCC4879446.1 hypothetical protein [Vibrio splendidus]